MSTDIYTLYLHSLYGADPKFTDALQFLFRFHYYLM